MATMTYAEQGHVLSLFDFWNKNCTFKLKIYPLQAENVKYPPEVPINHVNTMATNLSYVKLKIMAGCTIKF